MSEVDWVIAAEALPIVLALSFNLVAHGIAMLRLGMLEQIVKYLPQIAETFKNQVKLELKTQAE